MRSSLFAARLALAAMLLAALIAAAAVGVVRAGLASFQTGLEAMTGSVAFAAIAFLLSAAWLSHALKYNKGEGKRSGLIALAGSAVLLYVPLHTAYRGWAAPPIHDATTNPEDPPQFRMLAERQPGDNSTQFDGRRTIVYRGQRNTVSYVLHEVYDPATDEPITKPLALLMPTSKMFWRCFEAAKRMGWRIVDYDEKEGRIEARARSFWFGQVSDIVIRVRKAGALGARFDMRAESERGTRDFGRNLELIEAYRARLNS